MGDGSGLDPLNVSDEFSSFVLHNGSGWEKNFFWFDGLGQVKGLFPSLGIVKLWF